MSSSACYTNRVKVIAQAKNTKVNYPGGEAKNFDPIYATLSCNPRFGVQKYLPPPDCGEKQGYFVYLKTRCVRK